MVSTTQPWPCWYAPWSESLGSSAWPLSSECALARPCPGAHQLAVAVAMRGTTGLGQPRTAHRGRRALQRQTRPSLPGRGCPVRTSPTGASMTGLFAATRLQPSESATSPWRRQGTVGAPPPDQKTAAALPWRASRRAETSLRRQLVPVAAWTKLRRKSPIGEVQRAGRAAQPVRHPQLLDTAGGQSPKPGICRMLAFAPACAPNRQDCRYAQDLACTGSRLALASRSGRGEEHSGPPAVSR